jgi:glutamate racemase
MKVGVYDSGVGGLTVLDELLRRFPQHDYTYFGDTANVPYGSKSKEQILKLVAEAGEKLKLLDLDLVVVACNTVSCVALPTLKQTLGPSVPVVGVVEAGVKSVLSQIPSSTPARSAPVLVLGTQTTVNSHVYQREIHAVVPEIDLYEQACPLLVPMIEGGWNDHPVLTMVLQEYLRPYFGMRPGIALLACTHYPWIKPQFERQLPGWNVINSATSVADLLASQLGANIVAGPELSPPSISVRYLYSDEAAVADAFWRDNSRRDDSPPKRVT